jgi:hypothetical protein
MKQKENFEFHTPSFFLQEQNGEQKIKQHLLDFICFSDKFFIFFG